MSLIEDVIKQIQARGVQVAVVEHIAIPEGAISDEEREVLKAFKNEGIAYLRSLAPAASPDYQRGYGDGVEHTLMEIKARGEHVIGAAANGNGNDEDAPHVPKSPERQVRDFRSWQRRQDRYWWWTRKNLAALQAVLREGDEIIEGYSSTVKIHRANGSIETWQREVNDWSQEPENERP